MERPRATALCGARLRLLLTCSVAGAAVKRRVEAVVGQLRVGVEGLGGAGGALGATVLGQKSFGMTCPSLREWSSFQVSNFTLRETERTLPSQKAVLTTSPKERSDDRPPCPPQSTSGFSSLGLRVAV